MKLDPRVRRLVEEALDSTVTPEELCRDTPELLGEVRAGIARLRSLQFELDEVFPEEPRVPRLSGPEGFRCSLDPESRDPAQAPAGEPGGAAVPHIHGHEIVEVIGQGGMGIVYRANDLCLRRVVAVKTLISGVPTGPRQLERFLREAQAAAALLHPNIVQVHEVGNQDGVPYFTMEFVEGGSLADWFDAAPRSAAECAALVATLAEAAHFAHRSGIVHRDLKPSNVLLASDGTPKIVDFGVACRLDCDPGLTATSAPIGTPSYMSPEQARGESTAIGPRSDVYALGAILYEALTGRPPFRAESTVETLRQVQFDEPVPPTRFDPRLRRDLETICQKALQKDPERRYATAAELAADLRRFLQGEPIHARPAGRLERAYKWTRRYPARAALIGSALVLAASVLGAASWWNWRSKALEHAVRTDLERVGEFGARSDWDGARAALDRASARLDSFGCADLRADVARVKQDLDLVARLDSIRMNRSTANGARFDDHGNKQRADQEYEVAFREAGLGTTGDSSETLAARVRLTTVSDALIRALDDWAICAFGDPARRAWLLSAARHADPDPTGWRDRVRDPSSWRDGARLAELVASAPTNGASLPLLLALADRMRESGGDPVPFLRRLHRDHPDDYFVNQRIGDVLGERGDNECIRFLQAAVALRPEASVAWNHLGIALARLGHLDEAIAHLTHVVEQRPDFAASYANLGNAYGLAGKPDEAIRAFETALRLDPTSVSVRHNFGRLLIERGRVADAMRVFEEALALDPEYVDGLNGLGYALQESGRYEAAVAHLRRAVELDANHATAQNNLARSLAALGRHDEALAEYARAVELAPNDAVIRANLGLALMRLGRNEDARRAFEISIELAPRYAAARSGLGIVLGELGQVDAAIVAFEKARDLAPQDSPTHGALAQAYYLRGRFVEARDAAREFMAGLGANEVMRSQVTPLLERCDRMLALEPRLAAVRAGRESLSDPLEALDLAEYCRMCGDYAVAAEFAAIAFDSNSNVDPETLARHRVAAARDAARAGSERSSPLPPTERSSWRSRARAWLRDELIRVEASVVSTGAPAAANSRAVVGRWLEDPAFESVREDAERGVLNEVERGECAGLWRDVAAFVERIGSAEETVSGSRPR